MFSCRNGTPASRTQANNLEAIAIIVGNAEQLGIGIESNHSGP